MVEMTDADCAAMRDVVLAGLAEVSARNGGVPRRARELTGRIVRAALRDGQVRGHARPCGTDTGASPGTIDSSAAPVRSLQRARLTVAEAAAVLDVGERAVRKALVRGDLRGSQPAGKGSPWWVEAASVSEFTARRRAEVVGDGEAREGDARTAAYALSQ